MSFAPIKYFGNISIVVGFMHGHGEGLASIVNLNKGPEKVIGLWTIHPLEGQSLQEDDTNLLPSVLLPVTHILMNIGMALPADSLGSSHALGARAPKVED